MSTEQKSGELDPEIADLMGISTESSEAAPGFTELFEEEKAVETAPQEAVDLSQKRFTPITEIQEKPKPYFGGNP